MRKDESGKRGWPKHTRNTEHGKRGINKARRRNVKRMLRSKRERVANNANVAH